MASLLKTLHELEFADVLEGLNAGGPGSGRRPMNTAQYEKLVRLEKSARQIGSIHEADRAKALIDQFREDNKPSLADSDLRNLAKQSLVPEKSSNGLRSWFSFRKAS